MGVGFSNESSGVGCRVCFGGLRGVIGFVGFFWRFGIFFLFVRNLVKERILFMVIRFFFLIFKMFLVGIKGDFIGN